MLYVCKTEITHYNATKITAGQEEERMRSQLPTWGETRIQKTFRNPSTLSLMLLFIKLVK